MSAAIIEREGNEKETGYMWYVNFGQLGVSMSVD
jgi:hypothetical protein